MLKSAVCQVHGKFHFIEQLKTLYLILHCLPVLLVPVLLMPLTSAPE